MGTKTAAQIISAARTLANDSREGQYRRADPDYLVWLNDGLRRICAAHPEESTVAATLSLVSGPWQTLPVEAVGLVRPVCAMNGGLPGSAITPVAEAMLDVSNPDWRAEAASPTPKHTIHSPGNGVRDYAVYPPATAGATIRVIYAVMPDEVEAVGDTIPINDRFANALQSYILFRYFSLDAEDTANAAVAASYYKLFTEELA